MFSFTFVCLRIPARMGVHTDAIMAGSVIKRARREQGFVSVSDAIDLYKKKLYGWLPGMAEATYALAMGVLTEVEHKDADGNPVLRVYKKPPDLAALIYLTNRAIGTPRSEASLVDDALTKARTDFINTQLSINWLQAQAADMEARARRAAIECELYPKQFVTEEEQESKLRDIARVANKALLQLTPEAFAIICPGVEDPAAALEALKGKLGRDQAIIFEEVMSGGKEVADDEDYGDE